MISLLKIFEIANVPNGQANGLTVPIGPYKNPTDDDKKTLGNLQELNKKTPDEQVKELNKT